MRSFVLSTTKNNNASSSFDDALLMSHDVSFDILEMSLECFFAPSLDERWGVALGSSIIFNMHAFTKMRPRRLCCEWAMIR
jgi:hypothetical protein